MRGICNDNATHRKYFQCRAGAEASRFQPRRVLLHPTTTIVLRKSTSCALITFSRGWPRSGAMFIAASVQAQLLPAKADLVLRERASGKSAIEVHLAAGIEKDAKQRYETIYVLDGDWNTHIVVDVASFMRQVGALPPLIVVSVPNFFDEKGVNSRDHDPDADGRRVTSRRSGGAAAFLFFPQDRTYSVRQPALSGQRHEPDPRSFVWRAVPDLRAAERAGVVRRLPDPGSGHVLGQPRARMPRSKTGFPARRQRARHLRRRSKRAWHSKAWAWHRSSRFSPAQGAGGPARGTSPRTLRKPTIR